MTSPRASTPKKAAVPLLDAPMAVTTDSRLVANVTHVMAEVGNEPQELLAKALASGRQVFLGIALSEPEVEEAKKRVDDAAAEIVAMVVAV